jgi:hypothetical protein
MSAHFKVNLTDRGPGTAKLPVESSQEYIRTRFGTPTVEGKPDAASKRGSVTTAPTSS